MEAAERQVRYIAPRYIEQNDISSFDDGWEKPLKAHIAALVGKAGEALVAAELLRRHIDVAYPAHDGGVDLIAYRGHDFGRVVPIQVKTRTSTCYEFQRDWFRIPGLALVQVWNVTETPEFYIFGGLGDVEAALGDHCASSSWRDKGAYNVTTPAYPDLERMSPHRAQWSRIIAQFGR
jgi:hypothetical protein